MAYGVSYCSWVLAARVLEWFAFPPPVDHIVSEFSTMTHLSWVALHGMVHSFIELCKPLHHDKAVIHEGIMDPLILSQKVMRNLDSIL